MCIESEKPNKTKNQLCHTGAFKLYMHFPLSCYLPKSDIPKKTHRIQILLLWSQFPQVFLSFYICYIYVNEYISSVQFSRSVVSDSLWPHESQHARPPCPSPTPGVHSDSCPSSSVMPSSHLILCRPLLLLPPIPPSIRVFSNESTVHMRWPKYWSFSLYVKCVCMYTHIDTHIHIYI